MPTGMPFTLPSERGTRLVDLIGEVELRLTGNGVGQGLAPTLAASISDSSSYVLCLFDGLGHHQLDHASARSLRASAAGFVTAPFPTTTTVSLATIATGLMPAAHGVIGHLMWLPEVETVVNVLKWVTPTGSPVTYDTGAFLPSPNLWERLAAAGVETITVQPADFEGTPLSRALYRGCRFEGVSSVDEAIEATVVLSREPRRLVFTYFPHVDVAAHVWGQESSQYREALGLMDGAWSQIVSRSKPGVGVIGTADHGHLDYGPADKLLIRDTAFDDLVFYGDSRMVFVRGDAHRIDELGRSIDVAPFWVGDGDQVWPGARHRALAARIPDAILAAPDGTVLLPPGFDRRLTGYHGGLSDEEVRVPLLVG